MFSGGKHKDAIAPKILLCGDYFSLGTNNLSYPINKPHELSTLLLSFT